MINERNTFLKRSTPRSPPNMNENTSSNIHSPLKISSQMVLSNDFSQTTNPKNRYNEFYENSKTEANKNNYYSEDRFSQSFDVDAERRNRQLQQERQRDYENPQYTNPDSDYYYKQSKTSSDINDYNNRYTYNYRRDFYNIDFNKLYPDKQFGKNNNLNLYNSNNSNIKFNKPFEGPRPQLLSRGKSYDMKRGVIWNLFINIKMLNIMDKEILLHLAMMK